MLADLSAYLIFEMFIGKCQQRSSDISKYIACILQESSTRLIRLLQPLLRLFRVWGVHRYI